MSTDNTPAPAAPVPSLSKSHRLPYDTALRRLRDAMNTARAAGVDELALAETLLAVVRDRSLLGREDRTDARVIVDLATRKDRNR